MITKNNHHRDILDNLSLALQNIVKRTAINVKLKNEKYLNIIFGHATMLMAVVLSVITTVMGLLNGKLEYLAVGVIGLITISLYYGVVRFINNCVDKGTMINDK